MKPSVPKRSLQAASDHDPDLPNQIRFGPEVLDGSVVDRFEEVVRQVPERVAIRDGEQELTYAGLNRVINRASQAVLARRGPGSEPVALMFGHGLASIVGMLAALKANKFYVPLDPSHPVARSRHSLQHSGARLVLTDDAHYDAVQRISKGIDSICLETPDPGLSAENPGLSAAPGDMLVIFYTSGSTGQPKGVCDTHHNILFRTRHDAINLPIYTTDRMAQLFSYSFAASRIPIFNALLNGAGLCCYDVRQRGLAALASWLMEERISILPTNPTLLRHFASGLKGSLSLPDLRYVILGGGACHASGLGPVP